MYIVFVPVTVTVTVTCLVFFLRIWSVHNSMNFSCRTNINNMAALRRETTILADWKQAWNQFNNKNRENIHIEEL